MKKRAPQLARLLFAAAATSFLAGCYSGPVPPPVVKFDLPPGWEILEEKPGYTSAVTYLEKHGTAPYVKLETLPPHAFSGDDSDAKRVIEERYQESLLRGVQGSDFQTHSLADGITAYSLTEKSLYDGAEDYFSVISYSVNEEVFTIQILDPFDAHSDALEVIIKSSRVSS